MNRRKRLAAILLALLALTLFAGLLLAAADTLLSRSLLSSGGGIIEGDGLKLNSAIGQPVVGIENGGLGEVTLCSGFICPETTLAQGFQRVFLPVVLRGGS
jgi:hypothetical protein